MRPRSVSSMGRTNNTTKHTIEGFEGGGEKVVRVGVGGFMGVVGCSTCFCLTTCTHMIIVWCDVLFDGVGAIWFSSCGFECFLTWFALSFHFAVYYVHGVCFG